MGSRKKIDDAGTRVEVFLTIAARSRKMPDLDAVLAAAEEIRAQYERSVAYLGITKTLVALDSLSDARTVADKCVNKYDRTLAYASIIARLQHGQIGQERARRAVYAVELSPVERLAGDAFAAFLRMVLATAQQIDREELRDIAYKFLVETLVESHNLGAARVVAEKIQDLTLHVVVEILIIDTTKRG